MSPIPANELETLRDWLRFTVSRFGEMKLAFGHGSTEAYDEAAYLLLEGRDAGVAVLRVVSLGHGGVSFGGTTITRSARWGSTVRKYTP